MEKKEGWGFINSFWLHIIAMGLMLCDHMWGTVMHGNEWMTSIGRMAFPIFAFMLVEGYFHTKNIKRYILRLLCLAIISEIPFNLMMGGYWRDPYEQNVIWTFLIAILCICFTEWVKSKNKYVAILASVLIFALGTVLGFLSLSDYYGYGVLMVMVFYIFRGKKWWQLLFQFLGMYVINVELFGGIVVDVNIFGNTIEVARQGFALLSLAFIWVYNGEKGPGGKKYQLFCYLFYPVHILVLSLISLYLL